MQAWHVKEEAKANKDATIRAGLTYCSSGGPSSRSFKPFVQLRLLLLEFERSVGFGPSKTSSRSILEKRLIQAARLTGPSPHEAAQLSHCELVEIDGRSAQQHPQGWSTNVWLQLLRITFPASNSCEDPSHGQAGERKRQRESQRDFQSESERERHAKTDRQTNRQRGGGKRGGERKQKDKSARTMSSRSQFTMCTHKPQTLPSLRRFQNARFLGFVLWPAKKAAVPLPAGK